MPQYHPEANAANHPEINRRVTLEEYHQAIVIAEEEGLRRFDRK